MLSSLLDPVAEIARGGRVSSAAEMAWRIGSAVTTVVAAPGYPARPRLGERVTLPPPEDNVYVFHAGTSIPEDLDLEPDEAAPLLSAGGRVLAITGVAPTLDGAARKSRQYAERVQLSGKQFRHDIGWRELARVRSRRVQPSA